MIQATVALIAGGLAVAAGAIVFDIPLPESPVAFVLVYLLGAASMLAIGLLIGAVAPTVSSGQAIGMAVYFPMLFFAGVYFPRQAMPEGLKTVSDLTPAGAAVQALTDTWSGVAPSTSNLIVMAAYAIGAGVLAALVFRWE
jgi:ABC-2 type transport system permease protein